jgi:hypothetical protein
LARQFLSNSPDAKTALIPTDGFCPACHESLIWRDIVEIRNQFENPESEDAILPLAIEPSSPCSRLPYLALSSLFLSLSDR